MIAHVKLAADGPLLRFYRHLVIGLSSQVLVKSKVCEREVTSE